MVNQNVFEACLDALEWAETRDYEGWDPYDGLNSPLLQPFARNWFLRLVAMHGVNKAPVNLRPILRIPKERNPKGIALYATAYLNLYETTGEERFLEQAESLLNWLRENQSEEFDLPCWGYNFDWQNGRKFFLPAYHPSIVVTVFCGRSFLRHDRITSENRSLAVARKTAEFIETHINTKEVHGHSVYAYTPYDEFILVNTNALAADFFYRIGKQTDDEGLVNRAEELFEFAVGTQMEDGAWYYSVPADESHLNYDNFHTGFVLESLQAYAQDQPESDPARGAYRRGMDLYQRELFEEGAPWFEADKRHPYDVHAAAQGIITFASVKEGEHRQQANQILDWTFRHLYDSSGYFYRRQGRLLRDTTPYMRWSQAWMCRALSEVVRRDSNVKSFSPNIRASEY